MTRSRASLPGHRRVASALGAGVLAASLALVGCSSGSPKGGGTIPPLNTAGASAASTTAPAASGGASSKGSAAPTTLDAQKLTDESIGYYVDFVPQGLDTTQTQALQGFLAYDRATWEAYRKMDGDLSAVEASTTSNELELYRQSYREYQSAGIHAEGESRVTVLEVQTQSSNDATVKLCSDQKKIRYLTASGEEQSKPHSQHSFLYSATVTSTEGTWKVAALDQIGVDVC
ncbi:hypothetical protein [Actinomyces oris]|uniref:hypothetical protein n=1 Tax=Actinomyces oris TaxID=544580 RepID=UPI0024332B17|nr:hypothetical protein [Actinomyces oris]